MPVVIFCKHLIVVNEEWSNYLWRAEQNWEIKTINAELIFSSPETQKIVSNS